MKNHNRPATHKEALEGMLDLLQEYRMLTHTLKQHGSRQDPALMMKLTVLMMDLGLYRPSPP